MPQVDAVEDAERDRGGTPGRVVRKLFDCKQHAIRVADDSDGGLVAARLAGAPATAVKARPW